MGVFLELGATSSVPSYGSTEYSVTRRHEVWYVRRVVTAYLRLAAIRLYFA